MVQVRRRSLGCEVELPTDFERYGRRRNITPVILWTRGVLRVLPTTRSYRITVVGHGDSGGGSAMFATEDAC